MQHLVYAHGRAVLTGFLLLITALAQAQAPAWQIAQALSSSSADHSSIQATTADAAGNVVLAGSFSGTLRLGTFTLTSGGGEDGFVAKWNVASQTFAWAQQVAGPGDEAVTALAVLGVNVYVAGSFGRRATIGNGILINADASGNTSDVFVGSIFDGGSAVGFAWAKQAGGMANDYATALAATISGLYVSGSFAGATATFGSSTITNHGAGTTDAFVAKLLDSGSNAAFSWAIAAGGPDDDAAQALAVTGSTVYMAGAVASTARFGALTLTTVANTGDDAFVAKLTDAGASAAFVWAQPISGYGYEVVRAVAVRGSSVYALGETAGPTASFGSITLTNPDPSGTNSDVFITKLTDAGASAAFTWVQPISGRSTELAGGLVVVGSAVYVSGSLYGAATAFGPLLLNTVGNLDVFLARLNDAGTTASFAWAKSAGGTGADISSTLAVSGSRVVVGGTFASATLPLDALTLTNTGGSITAFFAALTDPLLGTAVPAQELGLAIYPNPAHGTITVQLAPTAGVTSVAIKLLNMLGATVYTATAPLSVNGASYSLHVASLPAGIYALHVTMGAASAVQRVVIE